MTVKINLEECELMLLIQLESGDVHQVNCSKEQLIGFVQELPTFQVFKEPVGGVSLVSSKTLTFSKDRKDIN